MGFSHFFVNRPIFAAVLSIVILLVGGIAYVALPVTQYPEITPPTIQVSATYPGANAETVAQTVAAPLEQEINGVEDMLYMSSQSTADGRLSLTITFKLGTDLDTAQVLVQNRVTRAEPRLPEEVRRLGVTTQKNSPDLMMVVHLLSPDKSYDQLYMANYANLRIVDVLSRLDGVGDIRIFGGSEYSMRVWLDPDRLASLDLTAGDVVAALRAQNVQIASGTLGAEPTITPQAFSTAVQTLGRLDDPDEFANIIVAAGDDGQVVRVRDVARVELGAFDYVTNSYLDGDNAVAMPIFQRPGTNALETADAIVATMEELSVEFPAGLDYQVVYNPTAFVEDSITEVYKTIFEAVALVVLVIFVFLQSVRASIIPILAIPISLVGTFAVMQALGFSLNNLTLFGLVLAIGIVVDDAIVVIENVERNLRDGLKPREAAHKTMKEVGGALVSMTLVLAAVFVPVAFLGGITGQFYRQFAVTITVATLISLFVSLTLSPALAALLLREKNGEDKGWLQKPFKLFNSGFDSMQNGYGNIIGTVTKIGALMFVIYLGLIGFTAYQFSRTPTGFIPQQDQGYFIVAMRLPPGASLARTDEVARQASEIITSVEGVKNAVGFAGFDGATFTNSTNAATFFTPLESFEERSKKGVSFAGIQQEMQAKLSSIQEAFTIVIQPPPVRGIGNAGGFRMMVQDRAGLGLQALQQATFELIGAANQDPELRSVFSFFETSTPQLYLDIDRTRAEMLGVPVEQVFEALEVYLGSAFVNDFNFQGRTFRVTAQADDPYRQTPDDILQLRTRNDAGETVPIGSVASFREITGPARVPRYNLYQAASITGEAAPGVSSGEALAKMEQLAERILPPGIGFEWTELSYQQKQQANVGLLVFGLSVVFVYLVLAAQYESWTLPFAVILIVPMCLLFAVLGLNLRGMDNNILSQIGFIVLIALASKNAILIVEFAKEREKDCTDRFVAAVEAARLRLRPILMTSFAFILGVVPLVLAQGAGAEMRQAMGTAVFFGMLGVTVFGLFFTPIFYVLIRGLFCHPLDRRFAFSWSFKGRNGSGWRNGNGGLDLLGFSRRKKNGESKPDS